MLPGGSRPRTISIITGLDLTTTDQSISPEVFANELKALIRRHGGEFEHEIYANLLARGITVDNPRSLVEGWHHVAHEICATEEEALIALESCREGSEKRSELCNQLRKICEQEPDFRIEHYIALSAWANLDIVGTSASQWQSSESWNTLAAQSKTVRGKESPYYVYADPGKLPTGREDIIYRLTSSGLFFFACDPKDDVVCRILEKMDKTPEDGLYWVGRKPAGSLAVDLERLKARLTVVNKIDDFVEILKLILPSDQDVEENRSS
jgi:hypothetical protein